MANKVIWRKWIGYKIIDHAQRGLVHAAGDIYTDSQKRVPFDDGELSLGARVSSEGKLTDHFTAVISYGNDEVSREYAVIQHEDLTLQHDEGEAKFLENAFNAEKDTVLPRVKQYIRNII